MSHSIPDITRYPQQWFQYFDIYNKGELNKSQVIEGFKQTFSSIDINILSSIINELWPLFDHDGSGTITQVEFLTRDGLCDTIVAQMNPHFNEVDAPDDIPTSSHQPRYQSNPSIPPPPSYPQHQYQPQPQSHFHFQNNTTQYQPQPSAPPSYSQNVPVQIRCGRCTNLQNVIPPPGARVFIAVCGTCGTQNQVNI